MVKKLYIKSARKVLQNKKELENKLGVKVYVRGTTTIIEGKKEVDEYFASRVLESFDFPFLVEDSLLLKSEDFDFKILHIKDHTKRHDLDVIKGRIIGKKGKTLKVLGDLTGCEVVVKDNLVAIIGPVERVHEAEVAVISLIKGSKQGNVYAHLEGLSRGRRKMKEED